jgi:hypothetical protein
MPERKIVLAKTQEDFGEVVKLVDQGWLLDSAMYEGRPLRLEDAVVYHLIKFSAEELAAMAKEAELEPEIISMVKVPYDKVDELLEKGYKVKDTYAKDVVLTKTGAKERDG